MAMLSFLALARVIHAVQVAQVEWLGINGGFSSDYTDSQGRVWHHTKDYWVPYSWGGYLGAKPKDRFKLGYVENNESLGTYQCRNWPPEYEADYEALLHHSGQESSWKNQSFRVNLQAPDAPTSYYTVKYVFCEVNGRGGKKWDIVINGKTMKEDYVGKWSHSHTDIYQFHCIPTRGGMIEVALISKDENKPQARFSTLEFQRSEGGCDKCATMSCGKGLCSPATVYDRTIPGGWGVRGISGMENEFATEEPKTSLRCACDQNVSGTSCENGSCAAVDCNEPFGGVCREGSCSCMNGYSGAHCEVAPLLDQYGCYSEHLEVTERMTVSTLCLPELIAGPAKHGHVFRGSSPTSTVADPYTDLAYFSWAADRKYGKVDAQGAEGKVYVSKVRVPWMGAPTLEGSVGFDGFVRASGIDITEDGVVGTICVKYWHPWVENRNSHLDKAAMVVAICEVNSTTMERHRLPWQIGKQYQESVTAPNTGIWGSYPLTAWFAQRSAGYGYLVYSPDHQIWTAWYGATVDFHTGYAMHSYRRNTSAVSDAEYAKYKYPVPRDLVEPRTEAAETIDGHRQGTGDHQASAAWRYHPILKDIGLQKHAHDPVYMQQYGLARLDPNGMQPAGEFGGYHKSGHSFDRVEMSTANDTGRQANALRPCGSGWIMGIISDQGNVCAKISRLGEVSAWKLIDGSVGCTPCGSSGGCCGGQGAAGSRMVRLAALGSRESEAKCGAEARFLFGYEKQDRTRILVELDGDCNQISEKMDVTRHTHWPLFQDWTTTSDGAVMWVTTWLPDVLGEHGPPGSPNGVWPYRPKPELPEGSEYMFGLTPQATNAAKVTMYYPTPLSSRTSTTTWPSTETSSTTSTTYNPAIAIIVILALVYATACDEGFVVVNEEGACRGAHVNDSQAIYYQVVASMSLESCKTACLTRPLCSGIEFSLGRCEVWTRPGGVRATKALPNFQCFSFEPPGAAAFEPVDGGRDRACRGASPTDNSASYMNVLALGSLYECKTACLEDAECKGIEFAVGRCEVWTHVIEAAARVEGSTCLALPSKSFELVNGPDQACRGATPTDNSVTYYSVSPATSLAACQRICMESPRCEGIEYSMGRCEVWSRIIGSTWPLPKFTCMRYKAPLALLRKRKRQRFLGTSFMQTSQIITEALWDEL